MQVTNTQYYHDLEFEDYLKMPGVSFSSLKDEVIIPSAGMHLGTLVHNYLLEPKKYNYQQHDMVLPIATALRAYLGDSLKHMEAEVAFTADFTHNGMCMKYKGRADLLMPGRLVIDIKVLAGPLGPAILRYEYDKQISGYCIGAEGAPIGLIVGYNKLKISHRPQDRVEVMTIKPSADSWETETVRRGKPITTNSFI